MKHPKITATIEEITPAKAAAWLETMVHNRKPKENTVIMYANDMINGKWLLSPQGIAFDDDEHLFDGQHRLLGVIRSQATIRMLVLRGFPVTQENMKTMDVLDSGAARSIADRLRLMGAYSTNPNLSAAICRQIVQVVMGNSRASRKGSIAIVLEISRLWKAEMKAVCTVLDRPNFRHARNGFTAAAFTIAAATDAARLDKDMGRYLSGAGLEAGSALLELRNALITGEGLAAVPKRDYTSICLSGIYCAWHDLPGRAFLKTEYREAAAKYFRAAQARRYSAVEKLFHSPR